MSPKYPPQVYRVLARFASSYDPTRSYYTLEPGTPIKEVIRRWTENDPAQKAYDDSMPGWYAPRDVWPFREYTWTRDKSRDGYAHVGNRSVYLTGPEKWDALVADMKVNGWNPKEPLVFEVGRDGSAKVGEGNHRLAVALEVGLAKIPVLFLFQRSAHRTEEPEPSLPPKAVQKVVEQEVSDPERRPLDAEEEERLKKLMKLLGM